MINLHFIKDAKRKLKKIQASGPSEFKKLREDIISKYN